MSTFSYPTCLHFRFKTQIPSKDALTAEVKMLRDILLNHGAPVVYCHNDLLCQNIIYNQQNGTKNLVRSLISLSLLVEIFTIMEMK